MRTVLNAAKLTVTLLAVAAISGGCPLQTEDRPVANPLSVDDLPPAIGETLATTDTGIGENAIRAEVGKFLLLRRTGHDVAIKIVEHTRPSRKGNCMLGARYECFVFKNDDYSRPKRYTGEVYEPDGAGAFDHVYVDGGTFTLEWSLGDWIYFEDLLMTMARTNATTIADVNFADESLQWHRCQEPSPDNLAGFTKAEEEIRTGVGENAIRAGVGRFILLKREGPDVALRILKHTRPGQEAGGMLGATYECFVFRNDDYSRFKKYTGEVYEPDGEGIADHIFIECGAFRIEWSQGDWIYFGDSVLAMARTDETDIGHVNFADEDLEWRHRKDPASSHQGGAL